MQRRIKGELKQEKKGQFPPEAKSELGRWCPVHLIFVSYYVMLIHYFSRLKNNLGKCWSLTSDKKITLFFVPTWWGKFFFPCVVICLTDPRDHCLSITCHSSSLLTLFHILSGIILFAKYSSGRQTLHKGEVCSIPLFTWWLLWEVRGDSQFDRLHRSVEASCTIQHLQLRALK